jgi:hypothetical protein
LASFGAASPAKDRPGKSVQVAQGEIGFVWYGVRIEDRLENSALLAQYEIGFVWRRGRSATMPAESA